MKRYQLIAAVIAVSMFATACTGSTAANADDAAAQTGGVSNNNEENNTDIVSGELYTGMSVDVSTLFSNRDLSGEYETSKCYSIALSDEGSVSDSKNVTIDKNIITITGEGYYLVSGSLSDGMIIVDADKSEKVQVILDAVSINSDTSAAIYVKNADKVFVTLAAGTVNMLTNGGTFTAIDENNIDAVIFSKDDLTLNGTGALTINSSAAHGIVSKDELVITNGTYDITAASHGLSGKDSVAIADGNFDIKAGKDAIHSENDDDDTKGIIYISGGNFVLNAESDGISALNELDIAGGNIVINKSYEGLEARVINICGGEIDITSSDDGLNATDKRTGTDEDANETAAQLRGGKTDDAQSGANINISGGIVRVNAEGDGIDSNGYITISGGEVYAAGSSNGGDGALDYGIDACISGGIVVAAGQSGMTQNFGDSSTQGSILVNTQQQNAAGSRIVLLDSENKELAAWTMVKGYNSVIVSCPEIVDGGSYTLKTGDINTEITMDGLIYGGRAGFGGGMHGGFDKQGGFDNQSGENGMRKPDLENGERPEGTEIPPGYKNNERQRGMETPPEPKDGEQPEETPKR